MPTTQPVVVDLPLPHLRLRALTWGPEDGPLALCLHGFPDTPWCWRHLGPELADRGYRVVAPYTRGYAPSDIPRDGEYSIGALAYDALAVHRRLGAGDDALLLGHDWGALTANTLAALPDGPFARVASLSVPPIAAMSRLPRDRTWPGLALRQVRSSWYILFLQFDGLAERQLPRVNRRLWRDWAPGYDSDDDVARFLSAIPTPAHRTAVASYYRALVRPALPDPRFAALQRGLLAEPVTPMLYLHGEGDHALRAGWTTGVADVLPDGSRTEVVPGVDHFLLQQDPERVNGIILDWLG